MLKKIFSCHLVFLSFNKNIMIAINISISSVFAVCVFCNFVLQMRSGTTIVSERMWLV